MRANRTYGFTVHFISEDKETALNSAMRLIDVNCKNKNFRYKYNKLLKEITERCPQYNTVKNPMLKARLLFDVYQFQIKVEGEYSKKMHGVQKEGEYYCIPVLHFIEDPVSNGKYLNNLNRYVEAPENTQKISDDEFLEYIKNEIFMN